MKRHLAVLVLLATSAVAASPAAAKSMICKGETSYGTLDSGVGDCIFMTRSAADRKISKVCKMNDQCEVRAEVDVKGDMLVIKSVSSVRLLKRAD